MPVNHAVRYPARLCKAIENQTVTIQIVRTFLFFILFLAALCLPGRLEKPDSQSTLTKDLNNYPSLRYLNNCCI